MIDKATQLINLSDLASLYLDHSPAKRAAQVLNARRDDRKRALLSSLLRDHNVEPVTAPEEIEIRDAFDSLLAFYSIVEIACLIEYVPYPLPQDFTTLTQQHLSEPAVRRYYEIHYPLLLPHLFRRRLTKELQLHENLGLDSASVYYLFAEFLGLVNRIRDDEEIEMFQWFLDDGSTAGFSIVDILSVVQKPEQYAERFFKPPVERDALDLSLRGFQSFLTSCVEFDDLLQRCQNYPLFQSALWHYFSYWFEHIGEKVGNRIGTAMQALLAWELDGSDSQTEQVGREFVLYSQQVKSAIQRLIYGPYSQALRQASQHSNFGQLKILFVDDDINCLDVRKEDLEKIGYRVFTATNARDAMVVLGREKTNMAIVDVRLRNDQDETDLSGLHLARQIPPMPLIIHSDHLTADVTYAINKISTERSMPVYAVEKSKGKNELVATVQKAESFLQQM